MTTIDLKSRIINSISQINDKDFLETIQTFIESKANEELYVLNNIQQDKIKKAKEQISNGEYIEHGSLMKEVDGWLEKK